MQSDAPNVPALFVQGNLLRLFTGACSGIRILMYRDCGTGALRLPAASGWLVDARVAPLGCAIVQSSSHGPPWLVLLVRYEPSHEQPERLNVAPERFELSAQDIAVLLGHELQSTLVIAWNTDRPGRSDAECR